jgi:hypothetical protein
MAGEQACTIKRPARLKGIESGIESGGHLLIRIQAGWLRCRGKVGHGGVHDFWTEERILSRSFSPERGEVATSKECLVFECLSL